MALQGQTETAEPLRAAQYLRMSTEHQQYSIANQSAAIALYAAAHQIVIVKSYIDPGKSGLTMRERPALRELIETVCSGRADFECILAYDVSRWGRFQDVDEAAHYEFLCRSAGINIHYVAEQFENNNNMLNALLKSLKRMMASEYSRELSVRVAAAKLRLAKMGFSQGGNAPYGLRRLLVDCDSNPKQVLGPRQRKAIQTDRVVYALGPPDEVAVLRRIFDFFTEERKWPSEIAFHLNKTGVKPPFEKPWARQMIVYILQNRKYTGTYVYAKQSKTLHTRLVKNEPGKWILKKDAFASIISVSQFDTAQSLRRQGHYSREELIENLTRLLKENGRLSWHIIQRDKFGPGAYVYENRFGGIFQAYGAIGYHPTSHYKKAAALRNRLRAVTSELRMKVFEQLKMKGVEVREERTKGQRPNILVLNEELRIGIRAAHYRHLDKSVLGFGWHFRITFRNRLDLLVIACLDDDREMHALYLIPRLSRLEGRYWSRQGQEKVFLEVFRFYSVEQLVDAAARVPIQVCNETDNHSKVQ